MKRRFVLALLFATVLAAAPAAAQAPSAQLTVRVRSTAGDSLPDARVRVEGTEASARTDGSGRARLEVRPGRHTVTVRHGGYTPGRVVGELAAGSAMEAIVDLQPEPVRFRELRVQSQERVPHLESVGFYQRQELGKGHFISRQELERNPAQR